jgi:hypothetical protein
VAAETEVRAPDSAERDRRINLARSILGHAPDITPVRRALMALEGSPDSAIGEAQGTKAVVLDDRELSCWHDGWEQGREQCCAQCQATGGDETAA